MKRKPGIRFMAWYFLGVLLFVEASLQGFYYFNAGQPLWSRTGRPMYAANSFSGFFNKPHLAVEHNTNEFRSFIRTNGMGLRVPRAGLEYAFDKPAGTQRVLLLGPSFAFGWGVDYEDSFAARLQDLLGAQVINSGVPGLGTYSQFAWYENVGRRYHADLLVQIIYASMAVDRRLDGYTVDDAGYLLPGDQSVETRLVALAKNSALVFYGWSLYAKFMAPPAAVTVGAGRRPAAARAISADAPELGESLAYYDEFRNAARASGATPVIVFVPMSYMIHRGDLARWRHLGVEDADQQSAFDRSLCGALGARGLQCIDLTPALAEAAAADPERLYYWLDVHWTRRGNAVASLAVAEALKKLSLARLRPAARGENRP